MVSQKDLDQAKQIGAQGGTVSTNGLPYQDAQKINAAVNSGRNGK
jgi:hypothetical protein